MLAKHPRAEKCKCQRAHEGVAVVAIVRMGGVDVEVGAILVVVVVVVDSRINKCVLARRRW